MLHCASGDVYFLHLFQYTHVHVGLVLMLFLLHEVQCIRTCTLCTLPLYLSSVSFDAVFACIHSLPKFIFHLYIHVHVHVHVLVSCPVLSAFNNLTLM